MILHERRGKHARTHRVREARADQIRFASTEGSVNPVERHRRLGHQLRGHVHAPAPGEFGQRAIVETAAREHQGAAHRSLRAHRVRRAGHVVAIAAHRDCHPACDGEWAVEPFESPRHFGVEHIAVRQLGDEGALELLRLRAANGVGDVVGAALIREPTYRLEIGGTRTQSRQRHRATERRSTQEADTRIKSIAHEQVFEHQAVAIGVQVELSAIAGFITGVAGGLTARGEAGKKDVVAEIDLRIDPAHHIAGVGHRIAAGGHQANAAATTDFPIQPQHGERGRWRRSRRRFLGAHTERAQLPPPGASEHAHATDNGCNCGAGQTDASAVEQDGREIGRVAHAGRIESPAGASPRTTPRATECKCVLSFEKELTFFGKEQRKAREIDLRVVVLDLGKIGAIGEVGDDEWGDAPLEVGARVAVALVGNGGCGRTVGEERTECVRLHVEIQSGSRRHDVQQGRCVGHFVERAPTP